MKRRALTHVQIIELIIANPPANVAEFARQVGCSRRAIANVIKTLETEGVISPRRHSRNFLWEQAIEEILTEAGKRTSTSQIPNTRTQRASGTPDQ